MTPPAAIEARDDDGGARPPEKDPGARRRQLFSLAVKLLVSASLIALVASKVDLASVSSRMAVLDFRWALAAFLFFLIQLGFGGLRWWQIANRLGVHITRVRALRLILIGHAFSQALPTAVGGDAVRAWLAARESGVFGRAISSVLCDRVIALAVLLVIASAGQIVLSMTDVAGTSLKALGWAVWAITAVAVVGIVTGPRLTRPLEGFKAGVAFRRVLTDIQLVLGRPWNLVAKIITLSVAVQFCIVVGTWCIARGLSLPLSFTMCLLMLPLILVATVVPISVGGWGVREGAMVFGLGLVGVAGDGALALSVLFGLVNLAVGIPGVFLWLVDRRQSASRNVPARPLS